MIVSLFCYLKRCNESLVKRNLFQEKISRRAKNFFNGDNTTCGSVLQSLQKVDDSDFFLKKINPQWVSCI